MDENIALCVLNAKYIHASPAPWCLAAGIKENAPELYQRVRIVEATINQPLTEILHHIVQNGPAVVGFSCYLWNVEMTLELCKILKEQLPRLVTVLGGPEVSYCAADVLQNNPQVDYILAGEGEESVPAFLKAFFACADAKKFEPQPQLISGLCGRREDGTVYESPPCVLCGRVPSPMQAGYAGAVKGRIAYFETSRGCPYSCAFCLSGRCGKPRFFSLEQELQNLLSLAVSGTQTIKFIDRTFNANPAHANAILQFILQHYGKEIPQGVCFHFEIAGDILRQETFLLLEQMPAGAVQLEIGMQSFSEKTLEAVCRKTDTAVLQKNIRRLVAMGNMHIHIDLIAGLPFEDLAVFGQSFNIGYALGAQMLQLGFLKLLHGSAMRSQPQQYPCEFDETPPYEVQTTPWLSRKDCACLHYTEDAVERIYNSGRFRLTAEYVLGVCGQTPFDFYTQLGKAAFEAGVHGRISLDDYTAFLHRYCAGLCGVQPERLRDMLVRDRLATNQTGQLPACLYRRDERLGKAAKRLAAQKATAQQKGVRRGIALLYGAACVCWVDYDAAGKNPVTGRWPLCELPLEELLNDSQ